MGKISRERRVNRKQIYWLIVFTLFIALVGLAYPYIAERLGLFSATFQLVDGKSSPRFYLEVANEEPIRMKGLMFRKPEEFPETGGMLFVFPAEKIQSFWMRNTYTSLDMIFINRALQVVGVVHSAPVLSEVAHSVPAPSTYVIEVHAGVAKKFGITEGAKLIPRGNMPIAIN